MTRREIKFGVIGCGLMGREFASAAARWNHLTTEVARPRIVAACDTSEPVLRAFCDANPGVRATPDYRDLLASPEIEALYIAIPHHLHAEVYVEAIRAGKHFLGEKPFGIDRAANAAINAELAKHPELVVRCSSEFPFFPGVKRIVSFVTSGAVGRVLEVRCGLLHSSDLDPLKPINWKRMTKFNGEYGCMGDLGMHAVHLPLRLGFMPRDVRAFLTKVVHERPDGKGGVLPCDTWDNALLACRCGDAEGSEFPMILEMKRIAPGHTNTWFFEIVGTSGAARFSTRNPRTLETLAYQRGQPQAWLREDIGYQPAYSSITGAIFEFGFPDAIQQMWAAYCDELVNGVSAMKQPFFCATAREAELSHRLFDAALTSHRGRTVVPIDADACP